MPEENGAVPAQPEEPKKEPSAAELSLTAELERVRSRNQQLKIVTLSVSLVLAVVFVFGYMAYRKITQAKAMLDGLTQGFQPMAQGGGNGTSPLRVSASSNSAEGSGLAMFSMPQPADLPAGGEEEGGPAGADAATAAGNLEKSKKLFAALNKYSDRPIMKEFLADMARNPEYIRAKAADRAGNPLTWFSSLQKSPAMKDIVLKYTRRPDFLPLMMELMKDPEVRPLIAGGASGLPSAMPPGAAAPAVARPAAPQSAAKGDADTEGEGVMTLNSDAISGPAQPSYKASGKAPPPVDSSR